MSPNNVIAWFVDLIDFGSTTNMEKIALSGISFGILEADDLWRGVLSEFSKDSRSSSVYECYAKHPKLAEYTLTALKRSFGIAADAGKVTLMYLNHDEAEFPCYHERYLTCPVSFSSFEVWALIQVAQEAELEFLETCSRPNNEVQLTGHLIQLLSSKSKLVQGRYSQYLSKLGAQLNVKKLELQVQKREKITGGDFALLFEWKDSDGKLKVCPVVFQAKRSVGIDVDISQRNHSSGLQLTVLSKSKCNPSYIFYNCDSQGVIPAPRLPTVKRVRDILSAGVTPKTDSTQKSLSLSMFMLDIMADNAYFVTSSRKEALNAILPGVEELELVSITTFSSDPAALPAYKSVYETYLSAKSKLARDAADDGPGR